MKKVIALKKKKKANTLQKVKIVLYTVFVAALLTFSVLNDMLFFKELGISLGMISLIFWVHLQNNTSQSSRVIELYDEELESLERKIN